MEDIIVSYPPGSGGGGSGNGQGVEGVNPETTNYTAVTSDNGKLISFNSASNLTLTLPATPPPANIDWWIDVEDVGPGTLTINPNGNQLDGSSSNLVLNPGSTNAPSGDTYVLGTPDTVNLPNSVANPTAYYGVDAQPATAGSLDDEFNGSSLNLTRWTWVNQGTASGVVANSLLTILAPADAGNNIRGISQPTPATPWTAILKINAFDLTNTNLSFPHIGMLVGDGTGKFIIFHFSYRSAGLTLSLNVENWTNATTFNSNVTSPANVPTMFPFWLKIQDNGTNLIFSISGSGSQFLQWTSVSRTAFLSSGPTLVGILCASDSSNIPVNGAFDYFRRTQ